MKKTLMICAIAILAMATACAQDQARDQRRPGRGHGPGMDPKQMVERRVDMLDKQLSLTDEQKAAITAIYTDEQQAMTAEREQMRDNMKSEARQKPDQKAMDERREAMKARQDAVNAKVAALLTPEQKTKFEQMKADREKGGPRPGHHGKGPKGAKGEPKGQCGDSCQCSGKDCGQPKATAADKKSCCD